MDKKNIRIWTSNTNYVDVDTGEIIKKDAIRKSYIIINKKKHATIHNEKGHIEWTFECTKTRQRELFDKL